MREVQELIQKLDADNADDITVIEWHCLARNARITIQHVESYMLEFKPNLHWIKINQNIEADDKKEIIELIGESIQDGIDISKIKADTSLVEVGNPDDWKDVDYNEEEP